MAEDKNELLQHYRTMREELLSAIVDLSDARMVEPSLDGWSVKDHLAHLAVWDEIRAYEVARTSAGHSSAWRMTEDQVVTYNAMAYELRRSLSLEQVRWEFETSRQHLLEAIASATERGLESSHYGEAPVRSTHEAEHAGWITRWRAETGV